MAHRPLPPRTSAGEVLLSHLAEQVARVRAEEPRVRADEPDSVHAMRVATRRLRSALRTFRPLLGRRTRGLREELRWLAGELGAARDAEVLRERLVGSVLGLGPPDGVPAQVESQLDRLYRAAHLRAVEALGSERYRLLLAGLEDLLASPGLTREAGRPAGKQLPAHVRTAWRTLATLVGQARSMPAGPDRDELLHEARKTAKQVRYAAEAVAAVHGRDARRLAAAVAGVQEVLGEHQDSVVARQRLQDLAGDASPEVAFAYGRLHAQEQARASGSEAGLDDAWRAASAGRLHRWLR